MALVMTARDRRILNKLSHAFIISDIWKNVFVSKLSHQELADIESGKAKSLIDVYFEKCPDVKLVWKALQKEMPKVHKALAKEFDLNKDQRR